MLKNMLLACISFFILALMASCGNNGTGGSSEPTSDDTPSSTSGSSSSSTQNKCISNNVEKDTTCCQACGQPVYSQGDTMLDGSVCNTFPLCENENYSSCIAACPNI